MFKQLKEFLKDPKKKSLTQLGLYFIFFLIIFVIISTGNKISKEEVKEEIQEGINNYNFVITITDNQLENIVTGSFENNEYSFSYNDNIYSYKDKTTYLNDEVVENIFEMESYNYSNIENLINYSESETTYKDSNKVTYNINLNNYVLDKNEGVFNLTEGNLTLTIEKDNYINSVLITKDNLNIKIDYSNINEL